MPTDRPRLFRQASLDRLSTSDRLDCTLAVSSAKGWLALTMLGVMTALVGAWSVLGEVSTFVSAPGILLGRGGVIVDAVSTGNGSLTSVFPRVGDRVEAGSVLALIVDSEVEELHRTAGALVDESARALEALRTAIEAESVVRAENAARQRRRYEAMEQSARNSVEVAREFLEASRLFLDQGLIARVDLEPSQRAFDGAQRELFAILRERDDTEYDEVRQLHGQEAEIAEREASLQAAKRTVSELEARLATHEILAPVSGRVVEIKAAVGAVLGAGAPVLSIRPATESIEALIYVPPADGKRIVPGMEVLVSPSSARREEYGAIRGRLAEIAAFPASGPRRMSFEEFDQGFTGACLAFAPGPEWRRGGKPPGAVRGLLSRLGRARSALWFALAATVALAVPGLAAATLIRVFIDDVLIPGDGSWAMPVLLGLVLAGTVQAGLTWLQQTSLVRIEMRLSLVMITRFLEHLVALPMTFFEQRFIGDITARGCSQSS